MFVPTSPKLEINNVNYEDWRKTRDAAYSLETLSRKIATARTEVDLVFIAEQAKTAHELDKEPLRKIWTERRAAILKQT